MQSLWLKRSAFVHRDLIVCIELNTERVSCVRCARSYLLRFKHRGSEWPRIVAWAINARCHNCSNTAIYVWPNITDRTGNFASVRGTTLAFRGPFFVGNTEGSAGSADGVGSTFTGFSFDLSRGNSIFSGNSMQPKALQVLPCIRT